MSFQITNNLKIALHRHLICYTKQICAPHFKKDVMSRKCQAVFYCSINRERKINLGSETFDHEHSELTATEYAFNNIPHYEFLKKLYPDPVSELRKIYDIVNSECSKKCLSLTYTKNIESLNEKIRCNIDIIWPKKLSFSCTGHSKKIASQKAALKCLSWLHRHDKINKTIPNLYTDRHIQYILKSQENIMIDLAPELKMEIQSLIDKFNNINLQIASKVSKDDLKVDENDTDSLNLSVLSNITSIRNNELKESYNKKRKNVTDLPILQYKDDILSKLQNNQVLLIKGDTGCGKSTQVPQFIIDSYIKENRGSECNVIVSEPRRIAAISLANRVAMERQEFLGDVVGYHVRFGQVLPRAQGSILYCTTGMFLRILENNLTLKNVSHVIIDEAHERNLQIDLILKFFKDFLKNNSHVKLIIMSATVNTEIFEKYFSCAIFNVPGILHPVKMHFLDDIDIFKEKFSSESNLKKKDISYDKIVNLIEWIIKTKPPGGILCFLPGWTDIKHLHKLLENTKMENLLIIPLHSKLANMDQQKIFTQGPNDVTKIILATDIAESSVTITDIRYVIDSAIKKEVSWNAETTLCDINIIPISQANLLQRKGRAGRVVSGESFHLITRKEYYSLQKFPTPEILKLPLEEAVITSKIFSKEKAKDFFSDLIQSPSEMLINSAINNLKKLGILDKDENFTNLGNYVKYLKLNPKLSKAVILSCIFQCLNPMLLVACTFSDMRYPNLSITEDNHNVVLKNLKLNYHKTSDHIAIVKYLSDLSEEKNDSLFYSLKNDNYSLNTTEKLCMLYITDIVNSGVMPPLPDLKYMNMYSDNNELIRAILFASTNQLIKRNAFGYKKQLFTKHANLLLTESKKYVEIKNGSVNYGRKTWSSEILTYICTMKFVERKQILVIDTSQISPLTVLLFSNGDVSCSEGSINDLINRDQVLIKIDGIENLSFYCEKELANVLLTFRNILWRTVDFLIEHESTLNYRQNLQDVQRFKISLMSVLSKVLRESSKHIDNIHTD